MKLILLAIASIFYLSAELAQAQAVSYTNDVRPILNKRCLGCHGGVKRAAGLSFLSEQTLTNPTESDAVAVVPGKPADSEMIRRILSKDDSERMPPADHGPALSEHEVALLRQWILEGLGGCDVRKALVASEARGNRTSNGHRRPVAAKRAGSLHSSPLGAGWFAPVTGV